MALYGNEKGIFFFYVYIPRNLQKSLNGDIQTSPSGS